MNERDISQKTNLYLEGEYQLKPDEYFDAVLMQIQNKENATPCPFGHFLNDDIILQLFQRGFRTCPTCRTDMSREWARIARIQQTRHNIRRDFFGQSQARIRQRVVDWLRYNRISSQTPSRGLGMAAAAQFTDRDDQRTAFRRAAFPTTFRATPANLRARFNTRQRNPSPDIIELSDDSE